MHKIHTNKSEELDMMTLVNLHIKKKTQQIKKQYKKQLLHTNNCKWLLLAGNQESSLQLFPIKTKKTQLAVSRHHDTMFG